MSLKSPSALTGPFKQPGLAVNVGKQSHGVRHDSTGTKASGHICKERALIGKIRTPTLG